MLSGSNALVRYEHNESLLNARSTGCVTDLSWLQVIVPGVKPLLVIFLFLNMSHAAKLPLANVTSVAVVCCE
jgi:hypothetical protein